MKDYIGSSLGYLVTGLYFVEVAFNIPGIAEISVTSVFQFDYPVIRATTLLVSTSIVVCNALSDVLYSLADPRNRLAWVRHASSIVRLTRREKMLDMNRTSGL